MNEAEKDSAATILTDSIQQDTHMSEKERDNTIAYLYACYILMLFMFTFLLPLIYLLMKRKACEADEVLSSHIRWQLRTIVYATLSFVLLSFVLYIIVMNSITPDIATLITAYTLLSPVLFLMVIIGMVIIINIPVIIWLTYRAIKGISKLADNKAFYQQAIQDSNNLLINMNEHKNEAERSNTIVLLYISYVCMLSPLLSFIYILIKRKDCRFDEVLYSHMNWQLITIIVTVIATIILMYLLPDFVIIPTLWAFYRMVKGVINLSENKPV